MKGLFLFIPVFFLGCTNQPSPCQKVDNELAKGVIIDYFQAISDKNFDGLKNLSTQDYVLYEDGVIWNNDSLIRLIKSMPQAQIDYEFKDFDFEADCNGSFINYLNHGILTLNDTTRIDYHWIESAYIKKVDSVLKLDFLHSTVAK